MSKDRSLEYNLEKFDVRIHLYNTIIKNYQTALIEGIENKGLMHKTEAWVLELRRRIKKLEQDKKKFYDKHISKLDKRANVEASTFEKAMQQRKGKKSQ